MRSRSLRTAAVWGLALSLVLLAGALRTAAAEPRYTRERSEELFPLIDWQDYGPGTFERALREQKPVFLVISAPAWCYWCHVYESEDYLYHPQLYPYLNEHFVMVFVDSDRRPDLTRKYLEGGWPSTTILAPDMRRIAGFVGPREPLGLLDYLGQVVAYVGERTYTSQATSIDYERTPPVVPAESDLLGYEERFLLDLEQRFDKEYGGFSLEGEAWREGQKFPTPRTYAFLLETYRETGDERYLGFVMNTFESQYTDLQELGTRYRLYDPVEGGFHRYGTKRDWSVPHYEKMLSDQAGLLRAYTLLHNLTGDTDVGTAVEGTQAFVMERFYAPDGGFYSSQDAWLEGDYFGLAAEGRARMGQPYVDRTRRIDGNAMMVSTLLFLYNMTGNTEYSTNARRSLGFMQEDMVGDEGAIFYFDDERQQAFLTGQAVSNSWALLAFVEGYAVLGEQRYLEAARRLADYSLAELYDWDSGGFFERHSRDAEFYAPNERIDLSKPFGENAVFAYGMLRLYLLTGGPAYLEAGMKTLGYLSGRAAGPEETVYFLEAARLARDEGLVAAYGNNSEELGLLSAERAKGSFVAELLAIRQEDASLGDAPRLRSEFADAGFLVLAVLALLAGALSFLSPCCLPVLSAYFAHNFAAKRGEMLRNTILFILGLATVFSLFGMGATLIGGLFREHRVLFTRLAGAAIIALGLAEMSGRGFSGMNIRLRGRRTPAGSYLFGAVFAIGWSACIGPILASLLLLSATSGTVLRGSGLLFIYAMGLGIPLILVSLHFDRLKGKGFWKALTGWTVRLPLGGKGIVVPVTSLVSGIVLVVLGVLVFNDALFRLNQLALQTGYVQDVIIAGEELLKRALL